MLVPLGCSARQQHQTRQWPVHVGASGRGPRRRPPARYGPRGRGSRRPAAERRTVLDVARAGASGCHGRGFRNGRADGFRGRGRGRRSRGRGGRDARRRGLNGRVGGHSVVVVVVRVSDGGARMHRGRGGRSSTRRRCSTAHHGRRPTDGGAGGSGARDGRQAIRQRRRQSRTIRFPPGDAIGNSTNSKRQKKKITEYHRYAFDNCLIIVVGVIIMIATVVWVVSVDDARSRPHKYYIIIKPAVRACTHHRCARSLYTP